MGDDGKVGAQALHVGDAEGHDVIFVRDLALVVIKNRVLHHVDRVVVTDGGLHQSLGIVRGGRADDLDARVGGEDGLGRVRVGSADVGAAVGRTADDDGAVDEATGHVADVAGVVHDLVKRDVREGPEHQLHYWADAEHRGTDAEADEARFGDRGIDDALRAELFEEAFGYLIGTVELGDFFAHDDDLVVALEFFAHRGAERFAVGNDSHDSVCEEGLFEDDGAAARGLRPAVVLFPVDVLRDIGHGGIRRFVSEEGGLIGLGHRGFVDL